MKTIKFYSKNSIVLTATKLVQLRTCVDGLRELICGNELKHPRINLQDNLWISDGLPPPPLHPRPLWHVAKTGRCTFRHGTCSSDIPASDNVA